MNDPPKTWRSPWTGVSIQPTVMWSQDLPGSDSPPIPESAVPNNNKVGNQVLCPHSRYFGSHFDLIFLMYLVSSVFSFKPTLPHQSLYPPYESTRGGGDSMV